MPALRRSPSPPPSYRARPGPAGRAVAPASSRERIFAAAAREFATHGFAATSVDRIAAAARLNKAMIYYHFGSKGRLYGEILREMFAAVGDRVREVERSGAPPEEQIARFVAVIAMEAEARPHFPPIWFREIADGGLHLDQATLREVAGIVRALAGFVESGVRSGVFRPVEPLLVHAGIVGPLLLFFASGPLRERLARAGVRGAAGYHRDEVVRHIQQVTIDLLRRGAPDSSVAPQQTGTAARARRS